MRLTPKETDKLMLHLAGTLAKEGACVICSLEDIRRYNYNERKEKRV